MNGPSAGRPTPSPRNSVNINAFTHGTEQGRAVEHEHGGGGRIQVRTTGAMSGISAEQMNRNLAMLEARCKDLSDALFISRKGNSKNKTRANKKILPMTDQINVNNAFKVTETKITPTNPVRPLKWMKWSTHKSSFCYIVMNAVRVPPGTEPKLYWESVLVNELNNKFVYTKSNIVEHFRKRFIGNV